MKYHKVKCVINEDTIGTRDSYSVIEPVWWSVSIYDGERKYNKDLSRFSLPQRYVFAIQWYIAEVCNGGHDQFYWNSTGIVWRDALQGLREIGAHEHADILTQSAEMMGGAPDMDRMKRQQQLDDHAPDFSKLDTWFYKSDNEASLANCLDSYVSRNAPQFYYNGKIRVPK